MNLESYANAWEFAARAHRDQVYRTPEKGVDLPYLYHIGQVVMTLAWALETAPDMNADFAIQCAILHDVLEDTKTEPTSLVDNFGAAVKDAVVALTKNDQLAKGREQMMDSLARIKQQSQEVWLVKLADRIANLDQPPPANWNKQRARYYARESEWVLEELAGCNSQLEVKLRNSIECFLQICGKAEGPDICM